MSSPIGSPTRAPLGLELSPSSPAPFDPVSVDQVKTALLIQHSQDDAELLRLIKIATNHIEGRLGMGLVDQTWTQIQNYASPVYQLSRRPALTIKSISYLADDSSTSWTTLNASYYYLASRKVISRAAYPSIREFGGWKTIFNIGYYALPSDFDLTTDTDEIAAARLAIPSDIIGALIQYVGHLYENKEGQGAEAKYEVAAKSYGALPANITLLLERHLNWRIGG